MSPGNGAGSSGTQISSTSKKRRRPSNFSTSPSVTAKNRYSPLLNANDNSDLDLATSSVGEDNNQDEVSQKIPPLYVYSYNITDFDNFHKLLSETIIDEFTINHTKNALKLNLSSIDDYRTITKKFDDTEIQYHTYQFPLDKQLSLIIRNLPVSITEKSIFEALSDLDFKVTSVTRLQNRLKCPIPIVAILLSNASKKIYALKRLLHCVVSVEPRRPTKDIPQCSNGQRFSHTKKFCHLPSRCVKCAGDHHFSQCVKENDMAGSIEANAAVYNKQVNNKFCVPTPHELMDSTTFTIDFADRKFVTIGLDATTNAFDVTVRISTSTRYVSISVDFLRQIFSMMGHILSIITNPPVKSRESLFLKDKTITRSKMYRGDNMLAIESVTGGRAMLNRENLLALQDLAACINETIVQKIAIVRPLVQGQLEQIAEYLKTDFFLEKTSTVQDIAAFISGIHDIRSSRAWRERAAGYPFRVMWRRSNISPARNWQIYGRRN
jgi:hypothetical protein